MFARGGKIQSGRRESSKLDCPHPRPYDSRAGIDGRTSAQSVLVTDEQGWAANEVAGDVEARVPAGRWTSYNANGAELGSSQLGAGAGVATLPAPGAGSPP